MTRAACCPRWPAPGAQVRETARLTEEAGLDRVTSGGRPRGLVIVARREGAVAARVLRALLGASSPVAVDVVPGPDLPVWTGPSDIAVVATRTGAGRYAVTPAYEAARRGVSLLGIGADDAPLRAACSTARAPYVPLPASRVRHTTLWSLLTPMLQLASQLGLLGEGVADPEAIAAALDEVAAECGPARESFVNPAKTLALELLDALPVIAAEGPLAGAAATRVADQLETLAGLPVATFRLPDQRVAACSVLERPAQLPGGRRLLPRPRGRHRTAAAPAHHPRHRRRRARRGARAPLGRRRHRPGAAHRGAAATCRSARSPSTATPTATAGCPGWPASCRWPTSPPSTWPSPSTRSAPALSRRTPSPSRLAGSARASWTGPRATCGGVQRAAGRHDHRADDQPEQRAGERVDQPADHPAERAGGVVRRLLEVVHERRRGRASRARRCPRAGCGRRPTASRRCRSR